MNRIHTTSLRSKSGFPAICFVLIYHVCTHINKGEEFRRNWENNAICMERIYSPAKLVGQFCICYSRRWPHLKWGCLKRWENKVHVKCLDSLEPVRHGMIITFHGNMYTCELTRPCYGVVSATNRVVNHGFSYRMEHFQNMPTN